MTHARRALALAVCAAAGAAALATGGAAHAACEPLLDPAYCAGYVTGRVRSVLPQRCEWQPDGTIMCYYAR